MRKRVISLLLLCAILLTGCGGGTTQDSKNGGSTTTSAKDSIIVGIDADAMSMDPLAINDVTTMSILSNIYEPLVRVNAKNEVLPALAESWEISEDGLTYTFHIRKGVKFHNGDPLTMEDLKWSIEAQIKSSYTGPYISCIDKVDIIDEDTISIVLQYPYSPFLTLCGTYTYAMKESHYKDHDMALKPIACGPYKFVSWTSNDRIVLEAFDEYYKGKAPIKNLTFKVIENKTSAAIALESGDVDVYLNVAETDVGTLKANPKLTVSEIPASAFYYLGLNTEDEVLKDVRVRQAIAMAIDREALIKGVMDGFAVETKTFIQKGLPGYVEGFDPLPYDIEGAKKLLSDAGYPNGLDLTITVPESRSAHAQIIQASLKKANINLKINLTESGAFWDDLEKGKFQIMMMGWSYVVMDNDVGYYSLYKSDEVESGNYPRLNDKKVDDGLLEARLSGNFESRDKIYREIEEIVMSSAAYIPLYWRYSIIAYHSDLQNITNSPIGMYFIYDYSWAK